MVSVAVIGGGASGILAAYAAAKNGNQVTLFEKNEKLGKKIYITGKGRCNLTNNVEPNEFLQNVVHGDKFLRGSIYTFPPTSMIELVESFGTPCKTERGNRVFPVSEHASDVTKALQNACKSVGVEFHFNEEVKSLLTDNGKVTGLVTNRGKYSFDKVIVCTGGLSYPATGSTGDGYTFAKATGHTVTPLTPSLTGINLQGEWKNLMGLSLKNVTLTAEVGGKVVYSGLGEMLFTHYGISGPLVLTLSAQMSGKSCKDHTLYIDFKPALSEEKLDNRILRDFEENKNKNISNVMGGLLPSKIIYSVLNRANIPLTKPVNSVTKEERTRLRQVLKRFELKPLSLRGWEEAVITCGGVDTKEINPKTMESKLVQGLYFAGEVLNVDAYTGGFNLQIAFSTGFAAGNNI